MFSIKVEAKVNKAYSNRLAKIPMPDELTKILGTLPNDEAVCLKYYYASMPISDITNNKPEFYLKFIRQALKVRKENMFNEEIPEEIFLNFVLPFNISSEDTDYSRDYFYNELYPRVKGLTAEEAILATNYWCFEKFIYGPISYRRASMLTLTKYVNGLCGESALYNAAALRSIGIPARSTGTPSWAHCNDNHAWTEAYANGKWHYMGGCDPEPALNKNWLSGTASKGVIIETKLFGSVIAEDDEVVGSPFYGKALNLSKQYIQNTTKLTVELLNAPENVKLFVMIANFGMFTAISIEKPNEKGIFSLTLGQGSFFLHITDEKKFINHYINCANENNVTLDFNNAVTFASGNLSLRMKPPTTTYKEPDYGITPEIQAEHERKVENCHNVRKAYQATFASEEEGKKLAETYGLSDENAFKNFTMARGNLDEIKKFFEMEIPSLSGEIIPNSFKGELLEILQEHGGMGIVDATVETLKDHLVYTYPYRDKFDREIFQKYLLAPRVMYGRVTPYKEFITNFFDQKTKEKFINDPISIWQWIKENISLYDDKQKKEVSTAYHTALLEYKFGTEPSLLKLFVAICRTLGIPAKMYPHLEHVNVEFYSNGKFVLLDFDPKPEKPSEAFYKLTIKELGGTGINPYYENFSLSVLERGNYSPKFGPWIEGPKFSGDGTAELTIEIPKNHYRIMIGRRQESGAFSVNVYYFELTGDKEIEIEIPPEDEVKAEPKDIPAFTFGDKTIEFAKNTLVAFIKPKAEPTEHLLRELLENQAAYKEKDVKIILVTETSNESLEKVADAYKEAVTVITVKDDLFGMHLAEATGLAGINLPIMVMMGEENKAVYYVRGYLVGSVQMALGAV